ncbi:HD domain protein [Oribacterium sp. oral taxon 078 str. F0262]|uniref:HD domain-containing protein n=1 Tax=Oribacterium sp. oral taxon 078 TaxID=652706 RepID=UPI0001BCC4E3|nr:HD domain-containing protein [Oribacterium sp. oral taxon 078]EFE93175.1 HD domain protein [Oribacterium sp. oral taxon 078 str. F0262]
MILSDEALRFAEQFREITRNPEYMKLKDLPRHGSTNTYDHSVRVAYMAYRLAPRFGVDRRSAAYVGLLHDFCMVDYHKDDGTSHDGRWYCFYHGEDAVENAAKQGFSLSKKERRAILTHMFPLSTGLPNSRLAYLLTLSDKTVAAQESWQNALDALERFRFLMNAPFLRAIRVRKRDERERH